MSEYADIDMLQKARVFLDRDARSRDLHSFPTRRSSDLKIGRPQPQLAEREQQQPQHEQAVAEPRFRRVPRREIGSRSEEHTSELQSHSDLVCRLLLEKKNEGHRG